VAKKGGTTRKESRARKKPTSKKEGLKKKGRSRKKREGKRVAPKKNRLEKSHKRECVKKKNEERSPFTEGGCIHFRPEKTGKEKRLILLGKGGGEDTLISEKNN